MMKYNRMIFQVALILVIKESVDCLQCFNCSRSSDMSKCTEVTQCQFGQSCFQRIEDNGGLALISMGCTDNQKCGSNQNGGSIVLGYKRETLQDCYECCSTYNCNKYLCAKAPCNCNFDDDTMCAWTNLKTDDFDWTIASGPTPSGRTGPRYDHTRNDYTGKYIYIETSAPRRMGDTARVTSQQFNPTTGSCMNFWYNMYGSGIGHLSVYLVTGTTNQTLWRLTGNQVSTWLNGQIGIKSSKPYRVVIEGVRGQSYLGDIAVDDISFTGSYCSLSPETANPNGQTTVSITPGSVTTVTVGAKPIV